MTTNETNLLERESVVRVFMRYLIPSLVGMMILALNIVVDGVMVGNRLGEVALAGVGIASPVYTIILAMSLWIGIGGATLYSQAMGANETKRAQYIFTHSIILIAGFTLIIGVSAFILQEPLTYWLGANEETFPYANAYIRVMLIFGFIITVENALSTFVRNDQNPNLAMISLVVSAIANIIINYYILYILELGVAEVALGTVLSAALGVMVLFTHFFRKKNNLRFIKIKFSRSIFKKTMGIGFPLARLIGTAGVAAFSVLNYVHSVMLMIFLGMGAAVQPLVSYYFGAQSQERIKQTLKIALLVATGSGIVAFLVGQIATRQIVAIFGSFPQEVVDIALTGIRLFFIAYIFMGVNFVMMSYFQSIAQIRMATWITASREIIFMMIFILILPLLFGLNGVWLSVPLAELVVMITIILYVKKKTTLFQSSVSE